MRLNIMSLRIPLKTKFFISYVTVSFSRDSTSWYCSIPIGCVVATRLPNCSRHRRGIKEHMERDWPDFSSIPSKRELTVRLARYFEVYCIKSHILLYGNKRPTTYDESKREGSKSKHQELWIYELSRERLVYS
jgi:hypothetical protein